MLGSTCHLCCHQQSNEHFSPLKLDCLRSTNYKILCTCLLFIKKEYKSKGMFWCPSCSPGFPERCPVTAPPSVFFLFLFALKKKIEAWKCLGQPSYSPSNAPLLLPPSIFVQFCYVFLLFEQNRSKGMFLIPQDPGREMPRCCFRQVIPSLPLLCSHVLHKLTFIPHFHSTHNTLLVEISSHVLHKPTFIPHNHSTHSAHICVIYEERYFFVSLNAISLILI